MILSNTFHLRTETHTYEKRKERVTLGNPLVCSPRLIPSPLTDGQHSHASTWSCLVQATGYEYCFMYPNRNNLVSELHQHECALIRGPP